MNKTNIQKNIYYDASGQVQTISFGRDINSILGDILGDDFRAYRKQWDRATNFELVTGYPTYVTFEMNCSCNLKCRMCLFGVPRSKWYAVPAKREFPVEKAKEIIREGVPLGLRSIGVSYWGEPLLKKGIIEFCRWAREHGIVDIIFVTNATLLTKKISEAILDSGITRLRFSLDAVSKKLYEKIRVGAKYEITHNNIFEFLRLKKERGCLLPVTSANFVLMEMNEHEVNDFVAFWGKKVDYVVIQQLVNYPLITAPKAKSRVIVKKFRCSQPFQRLAIRADGMVVPCCNGFGEKIALGNVFRESIKKMWHSKKENYLRRIHKRGEYYKDPVCLECASASTVS